MSQGPRQHEDSCTSMQVHRKVTVNVNIHDLMVGLRPNGASSKHLRQTLWIRSLEIYFQSSINGPNVGGMVRFELKRPYKLKVVV